MYCSNGSSSMATLLQQKNCMKTLTNGGVAGGTTASSGGSSGQQTRVALPHELAGITQMTSTTGTSSTGSVSGELSGASALRLPHHLNSHHTMHQQQQQHQQYHNNYGYYNNIHSHNNDTASNTMYRQASTSASSGSTSIATNTQLQQHHLPHLHHSASAAGTVPFSQQHQQRSLPSDSTTEPAVVGDAQNGLNRNRGGGEAGTDQLESPAATYANHEQQAMEEDQEAEPEIDIVINNVVCSFSVRCHLNLREIALNGINVEFRRENGMVTMKLRRPYTTASIWSSGRITCTGATSEDQVSYACLHKILADSVQ